MWRGCQDEARLSCLEFVIVLLVQRPIPVGRSPRATQPGGMWVLRAEQLAWSGRGLAGKLLVTACWFLVGYEGL